MDERGKRTAAESHLRRSGGGGGVGVGNPLLPGLPDEIASLCLARVPSLLLLWRVCPSWQRLISASAAFHSLRHSFGFRLPLWLYVLIHDDPAQSPLTTSSAGASAAAAASHGGDAFSWHAFDPLSHQWHSLPPLPQPVEFQLTSPNFIGLMHAVQCASSSTKLFMVAGSRQNQGEAAARHDWHGDGSHSSSSAKSQSPPEGGSPASSDSAAGVSVIAAEAEDAQWSEDGGAGQRIRSELLWMRSRGEAGVIGRKAEDGEAMASTSSPAAEIGGGGGGAAAAAADRVCNWRRKPLEPALDRPLIFDTKSRKWSWGPAFRVPRKWCACGTIGGKLVVASGCGKDWDMALSESAEIYDPDVDASSQRWVALDHLRSTKFSGEAITAVCYAGKLHMVSGTGVFRRVGIMYDPAKSSWVDMPKGMRNGWNGPTVVVDGKLLALDHSSGRLKCYDEARDCWITVVEDEMLVNMEQLSAGGYGDGKFCGIVRARREQAYDGDGRRLRRGLPESDVVRMVDIRDGKNPAFKDIQVPFGRIVALQVLCRTFSAECDRPAPAPPICL